MMKKIILVLAVFSLDLCAADQALASLKGLEGWGTGGVRILVDDHSKFEKTFDRKTIEEQVELRLRLAGLRVSDNSNHFFFTVNALPVRVGNRVVGYALIVEAKRKATFEANDKTYQGVASLWDIAGVTPASKLTDKIERYMDRFIQDYVKANPAKKEK